MKVTSVEIWDINCPNLPWHLPVIVRVNTDEGISGVGEVGLPMAREHSAEQDMLKIWLKRTFWDLIRSKLSSLGQDVS
jgi:L-alanine-DL-glutamate epimerase-like enolase superfamily enzyme